MKRIHTKSFYATDSTETLGQIVNEWLEDCQSDGSEFELIDIKYGIFMEEGAKLFTESCLVIFRSNI